MTVLRCEHCSRIITDLLPLHDCKPVARREPTECWAVCTYYEPFTMGGEVNQPKRFKVEGWLHTIEVSGGDWEMFCYQTPDGKWDIHERRTGAFVCTVESDALVADVVQHITDLILETPDFAKQAEATPDVERWPEVPTEEALRRLARGARV